MPFNKQWCYYDHGPLNIWFDLSFTKNVWNWLIRVIHISFYLSKMNMKVIMGAILQSTGIASCVFWVEVVNPHYHQRQIINKNLHTYYQNTFMKLMKSMYLYILRCFRTSLFQKMVNKTDRLAAQFFQTQQNVKPKSRFWKLIALLRYK